MPKRTNSTSRNDQPIPNPSQLTSYHRPITNPVRPKYANHIQAWTFEPDAGSHPGVFVRDALRQLTPGGRAARNPAGGAGYAPGSTGHVRQNVVPRPPDSTQTVPPFPETIFLTMDKPSPVLSPLSVLPVV